MKTFKEHLKEGNVKSNANKYGAGTTGNFADGVTETMMYEASYSYPVNDGLSITPGVYIKEVDGGDDLTGILVKSSFSF